MLFWKGNHHVFLNFLEDPSYLLRLCSTALWCDSGQCEGLLRGGGACDPKVLSGWQGHTGTGDAGFAGQQLGVRAVGTGEMGEPIVSTVMSEIESPLIGGEST